MIRGLRLRSIADDCATLGSCVGASGQPCSGRPYQAREQHCARQNRGIDCKAVRGAAFIQALATRVDISWLGEIGTVAEGAAPGETFLGKHQCDDLSTSPSPCSRELPRPDRLRCIILGALALHLVACMVSYSCFCQAFDAGLPRAHREAPSCAAGLGLVRVSFNGIRGRESGAHVLWKPESGRARRE